MLPTTNISLALIWFNPITCSTSKHHFQYITSVKKSSTQSHKMSWWLAMQYSYYYDIISYIIITVQYILNSVTYHLFKLH